MRKNELRTGMVIEVRNGDRYLVYDSKMLGFGHCRFSSFDDNLKCPHNPQFDVMKVWNVNSTDIYNLRDICDDVARNHKPMWVRTDVKEMTVAEVEAALGHGIKIVKENENRYFNF